MSTLLYGDGPAASVPVRSDGEDLWLAASDLPAATGWELKPEGICRDYLCVPVPPDRAASLLQGEGGDARFNLAEFARFIKQPFAHDAGEDVWYFGASPFDQRSELEMLQAPDFELPDLAGNNHRLSNHLGKKVFLLLWASW
jgi:hypothetical protein